MHLTTINKRRSKASAYHRPPAPLGRIGSLSQLGQGNPNLSNPLARKEPPSMSYQGDTPLGCTTGSAALITVNRPIPGPNAPPGDANNEPSARPAIQGRLPKKRPATTPTAI